MAIDSSLYWNGDMTKNINNILYHKTKNEQRLYSRFFFQYCDILI